MSGILVTRTGDGAEAPPVADAARRRKGKSQAGKAAEWHSLPSSRGGDRKFVELSGANFRQEGVLPL